MEYSFPVELSAFSVVAKETIKKGKNCRLKLRMLATGPFPDI